MPEPLRPKRGGFLRPFGCGQFIYEFLSGRGPYGSPKMDPDAGAPQADIFYYYKIALLQVTALDRATLEEERQAKKGKRAIDPERIDTLAEKYLGRLPFKTSFCRYHSFVVYFSNLRKLGWVEPSGLVEKSAFQDNYADGQSRVYYRLTPSGRKAGAAAWSDPRAALYGKGTSRRAAIG